MPNVFMVKGNTRTDKDGKAGQKEQGDNALELDAIVRDLTKTAKTFYKKIGF